MAAVAVASLAGLLVLAWTTFGNRTPPPPPDPAEAARRFADAWIADDPEALGDLLVRRPGDELEEALAAFDPLGASEFRVSVGEVREGPGDNRAIVVLLPELDVPDVGTWAWEAELPLERSRSSWRIAWDFDVLHPALGADVHFEVQRGLADRAPILAVDGTPLSAPGEVVTIGIEPRAIADQEQLTTQLETLVPEVVERLTETLARPDLEPDWFHPIGTVPASRLEGIRDRLDALPGILLRTADGRVGTDDGFGRHLLGRVVAASPDLAAERGIAPGSDVGVGGLEALFDATVRGGPVAQVVAVEVDGDVRGPVATFSEGDNRPVRTTLDADVLRAVEDALLGRRDNAAIAFVGTDGGLLGSASRPLTGYDRAFAGRFPPGAAVWPLTVLAAVEAGVVDPSDTVACPGEARVGGVRFENLGGFDLGEVALDVALAEGCRSTVARLAGALAPGTLEALAEGLGFGGVPDVALEAGASQWPPARDTAERAAAGIGQAKVLSSVVHLAAVAAAFSDGTFDPVHLLLPDDAADGAPADDPAAPGAVLDPAALRGARALFAAAGERNDFPVGTGVVSGESTSAEGRLAWVVVVRDDIAGVVLLEQGTRQQALDLARRTLAGLDALRS